MWLEYILVHFGVLVGMAGPYGMMQQHDLRDWAQRQSTCHDYLKHGKPFLHDGWWQLHCELILEKPPVFVAEERVRVDKIYQFMERTWPWQQLPWALLLLYFGGVSCLVWGISVRIAVSVTGHWLIGHFAHDDTEQDWVLQGTAVQGRNVAFAGLVTMGESWHNNHHAFPGSSKLGLEKGQADPGWWVLMLLKKLGLVWAIRLPNDLPARKELIRV